MIRYAKSSNRFMLNQSKHWITIKTTQPCNFAAGYNLVETGLYFWFDSGIIGFVLEGEELAINNVIVSNKLFSGKGQLILKLYNINSTTSNLIAGGELCHLVPTVTSGYTDLELESVNLSWFLNNSNNIIDQS